MVQIRRGDSLDFIAPLAEADGKGNGVADGAFVGWTVHSQIRTAKYGKLIAELVCSWVDPSTTRTLKLSCIDTRDWPIGDAELNVQFVRTSDGFTWSSEIMQVTITKDVTSYE